MDTTQSKDLQDLADALFAEVKAAEIQMDRLRWEISTNAQWRAQKLGQLKQMMPVPQIADRLGVTRQAIYAALNEDPPDYELERPGRPSLPDRLRDYADQLRRMVTAERTISIGPVGGRFLVEDLDDAVGELGKIYKGEEPLRWGCRGHHSPVDWWKRGRPVELGGVRRAEVAAGRGPRPGSDPVHRLSMHCASVL